MTKEEVILQKRMKELAHQSDTRGYMTCTDFLNLNEMNLFFQIQKELPPVQHAMWGGYEDAERKILCFYHDSFYAEALDLIMVRVTPLSVKYSDHLTHRDFLGALMHLGIERYKLGDILIKENVGYVITNQVIGMFIVDNLSKVKHTNVRCEVCEVSDLAIKPTLKEIKGSIPSERLDCIISLAYKLSRSTSAALITAGKVFVNGKLIESNSYEPKEGDIISVRGEGRFLYEGINVQTKKGRYFATLQKYI